MTHTLTLQSWQTLIKYDSEVMEFDILATKAIVRSETTFGVRFILLSKFNDKQKMHLTSKKLFLVERAFEKLETFDY